MSSAALSYLLDGLLIDLTNPRVAVLVGGAGGLLATFAVAVAFRRIATNPRTGS